MQELKERVRGSREEIIDFMREIVAIPSMEGNLKEVGDRIGAEMTKLGFEDVRFDKMGNIMGRVGTGKRVIVYDSHVDTVGVGDPATWDWDPFQGKVENGVLYGRGACDEKGSTPGMIHGLALARDLGYLDGTTAYYFGNMEEWCDGIAPNAFVEVDPKVKPDFVIIGEPTMMRVYRGHKGRIELKITATGRSAHAASHYLGDNAVYKMMSIIMQIRELDRRMRFGMGHHPLQGHPSIAVTDAEAHTASVNAVPERFSIFIDRRITASETRAQAIADIKGLIPDYLQDEIEVDELFYEEPSYTGFVFPVEKFYPPWLLDDDHPLTEVGQSTIEALWGERRELGTWDFSTNGTYWAGKAGIPSIGFGPGDEKFAHTDLEQVPLDDVVAATEFYALFPKMLAGRS